MRTIGLVVFIVSFALLTDVLAFNGKYGKPVWSHFESGAYVIQRTLSDWFG